jgi:hypothetical protein
MMNRGLRLPTTCVTTAKPSPTSPQKRICRGMWKKTLNPVMEMRNPTTDEKIAQRRLRW